MRKLIGITLSMTILACGGPDLEEEVIDIEKNPLAALAKMGEAMEEQAKAMEEQANKEPGEALHFEELIKYLPASIDGYGMKEPDGQTMETNGMKFSSADVRFTSENGDIDIAILDYNAAMAMYSMATAMWSSGFKIDTKDELAQSVKISDKTTGWETIEKKDNDVSLVLGVSNRFLVTIEAENQENTDFVKELFNNSELKKLEDI